MTRMQAIRKYFGDIIPVSNTEMMTLRAKDSDGNTYLTVLGDMALQELHETLTSE